MNKPKKASNRKSQPAAPIIFALFVFIALATVVVLEYIDYRHQRYSFIFTRLIRLQGTVNHRQAFDTEHRGDPESRPEPDSIRSAIRTASFITGSTPMRINTDH